MGAGAEGTAQAEAGKSKLAALRDCQVGIYYKIIRTHPQKLKFAVGYFLVADGAQGSNFGGIGVG